MTYGLPITDQPETWLRYGQDAGYDKHIDLLVEVWHDTKDERTEERSLHDFLHMSWPQYQLYMEPRGTSAGI